MNCKIHIKWVRHVSLTRTSLETIRAHERNYTLDISNRYFVGTYKVMKDYPMIGLCSTHRFGQHCRISGAIHNSRDTAFHRERYMQCRIWLVYKRVVQDIWPRGARERLGRQGWR